MLTNWLGGLVSLIYNSSHLVGRPAMLLKIHNYIVCYRDNSKLPALILLALSVAFDTTDRHFGISGTTLLWLSSC